MNIEIIPETFIAPVSSRISCNVLYPTTLRMKVLSREKNTLSAAALDGWMRQTTSSTSTMFNNNIRMNVTLKCKEVR